MIPNCYLTAVSVPFKFVCGVIDTHKISAGGLWFTFWNVCVALRFVSTGLITTMTWFIMTVGSLTQWPFAMNLWNSMLQTILYTMIWLRARVNPLGKLKQWSCEHHQQTLQHTHDHYSWCDYYLLPNDLVHHSWSQQCKNWVTLPRHGPRLLFLRHCSQEQPPLLHKHTECALNTNVKLQMKEIVSILACLIWITGHIFVNGVAK